MIDHMPSTAMSRAEVGEAPILISLEVQCKSAFVIMAIIDRY